jgi:hypothetical protein
MAPLKVWNKRDNNAPIGAVYVGRPSLFGNPFLVVNETEREKVVALYREWLHDPKNAVVLNAVRAQLRGKDLVCWCAPKACHADVLLEVANSDDYETT